MDKLEAKDSIGVAIAFHLWMVENDTQENAEENFHLTGEDMFDKFIEGSY